jgi:hypothetical protein
MPPLADTIMLSVPSISPTGVRIQNPAIEAQVRGLVGVAADEFVSKKLSEMSKSLCGLEQKMSWGQALSACNHLSQEAVEVGLVSHLDRLLFASADWLVSYDFFIDSGSLFTKKDRLDLSPLARKTAEENIRRAIMVMSMMEHYANLQVQILAEFDPLSRDLVRAEFPELFQKGGRGESC